MPLIVKLTCQGKTVEAHLGADRLATTALADLPRLADIFRWPKEGIYYDPMPGKRLYAALGGEALCRRLDESEDGLLLLQIEEDRLRALPWEYALDEQGRFLVTRYACLRLVPGRQPAPPPSGEQPLRLLFCAADPLIIRYQDERGEFRPQPPPFHLSFDRERVALRRALQGVRFAVEAIELPPTVERLQQKLAQPGLEILHLSCHGGIAEDRGEPLAILQLEDENGAVVNVRGNLLAQMPGRGALRLVLLSACHTAEGESEANLAYALVCDGLPAVIGMQEIFPDDQSDDLAAALYPLLLSGCDLGEALRQVRLALSLQCLWAAGLPVAYVRDGGWAALPLQAGKAELSGLGVLGRCALPVQVQPPRPLLGRDVDQWQVARLLGEHNVTIVGTGGMGKTALAATAVERFAWRWGQGVSGFSFAGGVDEVAFLNWLWGVFRPGQDLPQGEERRAAVLQAGRGWDGLLLLDNYESVLNGVAQGEAAAQAVHRLTAQLAEGGLRLLLTSREQPAGLRNEEIYPREGLAGLDEESGVDLFLEYSSRAREEDAQELGRNVWRAVEGYPLAIILLAGQYEVELQRTAAEFLSNWEAELQRARRAGLAPHQQTLAAVLERSLAALGEEGAERYRQLSVFGFPFFAEGAALVWGRALSEESLAAVRDELGQLVRCHLLQVAARDEQERPFLWRLAPALRQEASHQLRQPPQGFAEYGLWLAEQGYGNIDRYPLLAQVVRASLEALEAGRGRQAGQDGLWHERRYAWILMRFGELEWARAVLAGALTQAQAGTAVRSALLFELAGIYVVRGELGEAERLYRQVLEITEALGDKRGKGATLHELAGILVTRGELGEAERLYRQSLEIDEALGDKRGKGATLHQLAGIYVVRGELGEAERLYRQSLEIKEALGDVKGKGATLHQLAGIYVVRGELGEAERLYRQSLEIKEALGDKRGKGATLHELAGILVTRGELGEAERLYRQSLEIKEALGDVKGKGATLHELAGILVTRGELGEAERLYRQVLEITEALGDVKGKGATLHELAGILVTRGELGEAERLYRQSLEIDEALGDVKGKGATLHQLAGIYVVRGELGEAERLYRQSLEIDEALGDVKGKGATLHELAGILVTRGELGEAERLYRQSLEIKEALGDKRGKGATLHELAGILVTRGELGEAERLYRQSLEIKEALGDKRGKGATLHALAGILVTHGELGEAERLYRQSLEIDEALGDVKGKGATLHELAGILVTRGELGEAERLYRQSLEIKEALGDKRGKGATLHELAGILVTRGELGEAERLYRQSLEIKEALGDKRGKGATLHELAGILVTRGELGEAERLYRQSLEIDEALGDKRGKGATLAMLGQLLFRQGRRAEGRAMVRDALALLQGMGAAGDAAQVRQILQGLGDDDDAAASAGALTPQVYQALLLVGQAVFAVRRGAALDAQVEQVLQAMQQAGGVWGAVAAFFRQAAQPGQALPALPEGLPAPLRAMLEDFLAVW